MKYAKWVKAALLSAVVVLFLYAVIDRLTGHNENTNMIGITMVALLLPVNLIDYWAERRAGELFWCAILVSVLILSIIS